MGYRDTEKVSETLKTSERIRSFAMRLWHKKLIPYLPKSQLLSQWKECCGIARNIAIKGSPNHILVNRIMDYPLDHFILYSMIVADEMQQRDINVHVDKFVGWIAATDWVPSTIAMESYNELFEGWHNDTYLRQCLYNLEEKFCAGGIPEPQWRILYNIFHEFTPLCEHK